MAVSKQEVREPYFVFMCPWIIRIVGLRLLEQIIIHHEFFPLLHSIVRMPDLSTPVIDNNGEFWFLVIFNHTCRDSDGIVFYQLAAILENVWNFPFILKDSFFILNDSFFILNDSFFILNDFW